ncbi:MAG: MBL fold metallo-hydrolase [Pseudomonadota bacterium]
MKIEIIDAGHGDCILVTCGAILILIDSGPKSFKIRKSVIDSLKALLNGREIDVAIVTHNDDDHIGGFGYIIDSNIKIKKFIFNSLSYISKVLKLKGVNKQISYQQDINLQQLLIERDIEVIAVNASDKAISLGPFMQITPLTPDPSVLVMMYDDAIKKNKQISTLIKKELSISECIELIKKGEDVFERDRSITNKSSLSFIIEHNGNNFLFLGDSHEDDVVSALKKYSHVKFKAVKLSHHGSERNTSNELLSLIGKTDYIICGDKSSHAHPNRKTISRILCFDSSPKFHLSAENIELKEMFAECENEGFQVNVTYPINKINRVIYE